MFSHIFLKSVVVLGTASLKMDPYIYQKKPEIIVVFFLQSTHISHTCIDSNKYSLKTQPITIYNRLDPVVQS